jgi:hypothetical protein
MNTDDALPKLRTQFEDAADSTVQYRADAEQWRDYYDGKQWTTNERETLKKRGQPCITDNRVGDKVQYLLGLERKTRTDPKAYPRNPQDEGSAEAATDAIRYVFDCNDFQQVRSAVFENMLVEGVGAVEVVRDGKKDKIRKIRWDRFYADPHSMELDYSDALFLGVVAWMDEKRLIQRYPQAREMIEGQMSEAQRTYTETYDDKPQLRWIDVKRRRLQVFEHYYWDGKWMRAVFIKGGFLEEPQPSPYIDEDGIPECPIVAQAAFRDRDGNPYGVVRRYKDLQDEINKRRSKALHALSARRVVADQGAVPDVNKARIEVQRPDGYLEVTPGMRFDVDVSTDIGMSQFQLLQDAIQSLASTGPNAALQGQSGQISGKAKQLDQEGGAIQIGALFDQIRHLQKRVARMTWNRVKQFWTDETWVRVTDDEQKLKFVGLNVPVTAGEQQVEQMKGMGLAPEEMQMAVAQIAMDPMSRVPVAKKNDVAAMDVDIIIEEMPDVVTLQQEQFAELVSLANAQVIFPPEVYVEASGLRNKQRLLEMLKGGGEMSPEQQQQQQQQQEMAQMAADLEMRAKAAQAQKDEATAQKTVVETAVMAADAMEPKVEKVSGEPR